MNERVGACGELVGERWEGRRVCESARAGDRVGGGDGRVWVVVVVVVVFVWSMSVVDLMSL